MGHSSVPTLTVGGFLGSGKTTLINHLLSQSDGRRIVVFVNDFGAINIDHALIETVEEDRIALSNGCVCCSLNDDLIRSMIEFCQSDAPDLFVIEASGVADPKALASTLQALKAAGHAHLQSCVYVVDAGHFGTLDYADTEDLIDHAASSDLIVVNKSDLVPPERLGNLGKLLARSAPGVARQVTTKAKVSWDDVRARASVGTVAASTRPARHTQHTDFATVTFEDFPPLSEYRLKALVELMKDTCLRAKGYLTMDHMGQPTKLLQLVGQHMEMTSLPPDTAERAQLVVIGWSNTLPVEQVSKLLKADPISQH